MSNKCLHKKLAFNLLNIILKSTQERVYTNLNNQKYETKSKANEAAYSAYKKRRHTIQMTNYRPINIVIDQCNGKMYTGLLLVIYRHNRLLQNKFFKVSSHVKSIIIWI